MAGEPLLVEKKNQHPFEFTPFVKWIVACNNLPDSRDKSYGFSRRIAILPFKVTFTDDQQDKTLAKRIIREELSGVLNWSIDGYKSLMTADQFIVPAASTQALNEYRKKIDPTLEFIEEHLTVDSFGSTEIPLKTLYLQFYKPWCEDTGRRPVSNKTLLNTITKELGIETGRTVAGRTLYGVSLVPG